LIATAKMRIDLGGQWYNAPFHEVLAMLDPEQDEPQSERSMKAYERGVAWANEKFDQWLESGRAVPPDVPLTEADAAEVFSGSVYPDPVTRTRMVLIAFDAARLRWSRLVELGMTRESNHDIDPPDDSASNGAA
jgi:hypothetical protein